MPHAELKYTSDLRLDAVAVLRGIEAVIHRHDDGAGACKGRAFRVEEYHHSHCLLTVDMLAKPHRDAAFTAALSADIEAELTRHLTQPCSLGYEIRYMSPFYVTKTVQPDGE